MEKHERFRELKNGKLPEAFQRLQRNLSQLIVDMTDKSPSKRPETKYILNAIKEEINDIDNFNKVFNSPAKEGLSQQKRNRFFSEEISHIKSYEFIMTFLAAELDESPRRVFVKIVADKLLILPNKQSSKAMYVYDLTESEITNKNTNSEIQIVIDHPYLNKCKLTNESDNDSLEFLESIKA